MSRIRTVKPEIFRHEILFDLERQTGLPIRLAWIGLFTVCDREGRFKWMPRRMGAEILPYDEIDFSRVLHAWLTCGLILKYSVTTGSQTEFYGFIPTFRKHQFINNKEPDSSLPDPYSEKAVIEQYHALTDAFATRELPVSDAFATRIQDGKGEGKGREGKGKEGKGNILWETENFQEPKKGKKGSVGIRLDYPQAFNELWEVYGRRGDKKEALHEFENLKLSPSELEDLRKAVKNYSDQTELNFRKHFCRFLKSDWREYIERRPIVMTASNGHGMKLREHVIADHNKSVFEEAYEELRQEQLAKGQHSQ